MVFIIRQRIVLIAVLYILMAGHMFSSGPMAIKIDDILLWRNHSTTISPNGRWYTIKYALNEKHLPDNVPAKYKYGEDAASDVLFIRHSKSNKQYRIQNAVNPIFSPDSNWIAYSINEKSKKINTIYLHQLSNGRVYNWNSKGTYRFLDNGDKFMIHHNKELMFFNLVEFKKHYIANVSAYLIDEKGDILVYAIESKNMIGNGIYSYNFKTKETRSLDRTPYQYKMLSWNHDKSGFAGIKFLTCGKKNKEIIIFTFLNISSPDYIHREYNWRDIAGRTQHEPFAITNPNIDKIIWSKDNKRFFLDLISDNDVLKQNDKLTVDIWHWKDKKLISQQMIDASKNRRQHVFAILDPGEKKIIPVADSSNAKIFTFDNMNRWTIGFFFDKIHQDWNVTNADLYLIDLKSGNKKIIKKNIKYKRHHEDIHISMNGKDVVFWNAGHYWHYNLESQHLKNITKNLSKSFIDREYDKYGLQPSYGFVAWVKNERSVLINHKFDVWKITLLPESHHSVNLTGIVRENEPIRFRFFKSYNHHEKRMRIDLKQSQLLTVFNKETKYSGYYALADSKLKPLIYKPAFFSNTEWTRGLIKAENADTIIFKMGSYRKYSESYLSDIHFKSLRKITDTNPQQNMYKWGKRVLINYKNKDGIDLQGILSIPDNHQKGKRLPMIVYSYEKLSDYLHMYPAMEISGMDICEMQYVSDGYLFLYPDIHFNIGSPHADMHDCINAAVKKVIEMGYVDEKCIGYQGFSFGGHAGMYISTQPNHFSAIAAGAGVSNLINGFTIDIAWDGSNEQDYYMIKQGRIGTDPVNNLDIYIRESPIFHAKNMNQPLLLFHGTSDDVVPWNHSFGFYNLLRYLGKSVMFLSYKGEGHGLETFDNRVDLNKRLKQFFDYYLKDKKDVKWIKEVTGYSPKKNIKKRRTVRFWE